MKDKKNRLELIVPSFRPDISQEVDIIEELIRIKGFDNIPLSEPNKISFKNTLNYKQKIFHYIQSL